ncbi:MAG: hypothetical protein JW720_13430 [Sedimentisphaerales bacterium]|nr:hypothetical protein [Sedimentisphaerales bacterium]
MNRSIIKKIVVLSLLVCISLPLAVWGEEVFWQIGKNDNHTAEFALGPDKSNDYSVRFAQGAVFVVGQSEAKQDWPYIQPGPADTWAGSKQHSFRIFFGLESIPSEGDCQLIMDFVDTHSTQPPKLVVKVNNATFECQLPKGAGDDSAFGQPEKGREHIETVSFPTKTLKVGTNEISITSAAGSWILYDYVVLKTPPGARKGPLEGTTSLLGVDTQPVLVRGTDGKLYQPVEVSLLHTGEAVEATVLINGVETVRQSVKGGYRTVDGLAPAVDEKQSVNVDVRIDGKSMSKKNVTLSPVRKWEIYLLHHSHVDIGYTHVQTEVLQKHFGYFDEVIELARKSKDYPAGSQFKWNVEVLWAVDAYLKQASEEKRQQFIEAVKKGWIALDALYGNELTALCRPEELIRLLGCAEGLRRQCRVPIDSAMITDVPGYTWGIVPVLAQSGVKYFAVGPNRGHRIGYTLSQWGDKPFYWQSPSGKEKVLCWVAGEGYSLFHSGRLDSGRLFRYLNQLGGSDYPYDMVHVRYSIGGDNGPPDPGLSDYVKAWNEKYAYPKIVVSTAGEMCREFERRYGDRIPTASGDFTPYWEDGAGSSARETAINREAAERLVQAETLYALLDPKSYPAGDFYDAWHNVILYDEHTWGAHCSISQPESNFTKAQWKIKQAFALDGDTQSRKLLENSLAAHKSTAKRIEFIDVFNTCSWARTDLVVLSSDWQLAGDLVRDNRGKKVGSQRLSHGDLAFMANDVPPMGSKRFRFDPGPVSTGTTSHSTTATDARLSNGLLEVEIDAATGDVKSLRRVGISENLVDYTDSSGLNDYLYVAGRNPKEPLRNGPVTISVKERGAMMASLVVESDAPGCRKLIREVRLISGLDRVDIIDTIDKENVYKQEAVHLGFAFNVPEGTIRMEVPWGVVRPETDQLAGACKNYFTVQRWVDVSNAAYGVTLATIDAPLIEVGAITNDPRGGVGWIKNLEPTTTLYSYVMNNYWETNYKASQDGPTVFRYSIRPHKKLDAGQAARFGIERSTPLIVAPVDEATRVCESAFSVKPDDVIVTAFKPSEDGKARIVRLYNTSGKSCKAKIEWARPAPSEVWLSNPGEEQISRLAGTIDMAGYEFVTLRVPLSE